MYLKRWFYLRRKSAIKLFIFFLILYMTYLSLAVFGKFSTVSDNESNTVVRPLLFRQDRETIENNNNNPVLPEPVKSGKYEQYGNWKVYEKIKNNGKL